MCIRDSISALCDAYAEALSRDSVTVDDIPALPKKYQTNFDDQRKMCIRDRGKIDHLHGVAVCGISEEKNVEICRLGIFVCLLYTSRCV